MNRESIVIIEKLFWSVNEPVQLFKDLWAQPSADKNVCQYTQYVVEVFFKATA